MMGNFSLLYLGMPLLMLYASVIFSNKFIKLSENRVSNPEIDGLRGYLAFFVFLHHSYVWRVYLQTKIWKTPENNLFNHFGQTSVSLFFMITAFLFFSKLLAPNAREINWKKYIRSRFFRLAPMYWVSVLIVFLLAFLLSGFKLVVPFLQVLKNMVSWVLFSVNGSPEINNIKDSFTINSGVAWTLPYEWMFYFLLPVLALCCKIRVRGRVLIPFITAFGIILFLNKSSLRNFTPFLAGIIAAIIVAKIPKSSVLKKPVFTVISLTLLIIIVFYFNSGRKPVPVMVTGFLFTCIASGNSLFGILKTHFSRKFGQITYSIYLLHGIILFVAMRSFEYQNVAGFSDFQYWLMIALCTLPLIFLSQLAYKYIELPFIAFGKRNR